MFEARNLHKRFGSHVVLEDVSMRFEAGRLSGIMGPNGAGKTTCFNLLTGRYAPDRGSVTFEGRDITGLPPRRIARLGVSRSFQIMNLFDDYSALDNVMVAMPQTREKGFSMLRDRTSDLMETYRDHVNSQLNNIMRSLTVLSAIFMPLSFVTSFYGMNFTSIPAFKWFGGFPIAVALMIAIAVGGLTYARRRKWL